MSSSIESLITARATTYTECVRDRAEDTPLSTVYSINPVDRFSTVVRARFYSPTLRVLKMQFGTFVLESVLELKYVLQIVTSNSVIQMIFFKVHMNTFIGIHGINLYIFNTVQLNALLL